MKCRTCSNKAIEGKTCCQSCLDKNAEYQRQYAAKRKSNGLCIDCGSKADNGVYCSKCHSKRKSLARKRYKKNRANKVCSHCGKETEGSKRLCPDCLAMYKKIREQRERKSPRYKAKQRDNFSCQICGIDKDLHVHHIDEQGERFKNSMKRRPANKVNDDLENLVTLCRGCHSAITRLLNRNTENAIKILQGVNWD